MGAGGKCFEQDPEGFRNVMQRELRGKERITRIFVLSRLFVRGARAAGCL